MFLEQEGDNMTISIQVYGNLKETSAVGSEIINHQVKEDCRVNDLLGDLNICDSEVQLILRNGQRARIDSKLRTRDLLEIY